MCVCVCHTCMYADGFIKCKFHFSSDGLERISFTLHLLSLSLALSHTVRGRERVRGECVYQCVCVSDYFRQSGSLCVLNYYSYLLRKSCTCFC